MTDKSFENMAKEVSETIGGKEGPASFFQRQGKALIEALERADKLEKALAKIAVVYAWGYPEKINVTPSEVRQLARAALKGGE